MKKIYVYTDHPYCKITGEFCQLGDCGWWKEDCPYKITKEEMENGRQKPD